MAPEIFDKNGYSFEVDIWALGIIMYNLLTGLFPFYDKDKDKIPKLIMEKDFTFPDKPKISNVAKDLINQILEKDPKKRPNLNQILFHDFFHIGTFPEFPNIETLVKGPNLDEIKTYRPNADENGFVNKEIKTELKKLYKLKIPDIIEIKYNNIENYTLEKLPELKGFDYWLTFFHKSLSNNFYYYEVNNGLIGIFYDKDNTNLLYNNENKKFYHIILK